ncbi:hypothetical protein HK102_012782 [Quaeritorhiza haematococci]|nr:hypothetical protein HK102_012782 [Quaeritorhiza haematococci]
MEETETFTPEDAAQLLQKEPYANIARQLDISAQHVFYVDPPSKEDPRNQPEKMKPLQVDERQTGAAQFVFTDVESKKMLVRDPNGVLRNATTLERWWKRNSKPEFRT